jgi:regulatory protein
MEITKIEVQKRHSKRRSIYIDGKYEIGVSEETLLKFGIVEGMRVGNEDIKKIEEYETAVKAREYALLLLSYRPRSEKELITKMRLKGYDAAVIGNVIEMLERAGLVNDLDFARLYISTKKDGMGKYRIRRELIKKGIAKELIEKVFQDAEIDEISTAKNLIAKWTRTHHGLDPFVRKRRLIGFLLRRGISWDTIETLQSYIKTIITQNSKPADFL